MCLNSMVDLIYVYNLASPSSPLRLPHDSPYSEKTAASQPSVQPNEMPLKKVRVKSACAMLFEEEGMERQVGKI